MRFCQARVKVQGALRAKGRLNPLQITKYPQRERMEADHGRQRERTRSEMLGTALGIHLKC